MRSASAPKREQKREAALPSWMHRELKAQMEEAAEMYDNASRVFEDCIVDSEKLKRKMAQLSHSVSRLLSRAL